MSNPPPAKNRRVLIIDDNRAIHDDFRKILSPATSADSALDAAEAALFGKPTETLSPTQFEVDSAYQGEEGLARVAEAFKAGRPYAVAFVDVRMPPGWDGVETTARLWAIDPDLQIVLCTAYSDYSWNEMFEKLGQRDGLLILKKPFDSVEALQLAHALTEKWSLHHQSRRKLEESEERFAGAFEHAPIGVALLSPEGKWLKVNQALCALVGYSEAELLTLTFQDITHPDDLEADLGHVRQILAGEIFTYQMEKRYFHRLGHVVTVLLSVSLVRDEQGLPLYFISQIQDISERKRTENALRESDEKFHQLADNITDAFWIRSADMRELHYLSPAFERIWGRSVAVMMACPETWIDFVFPEDREPVQSAFAKLVAGGKSLDIEYRIVRPDGGIRWIRVRAFQVRDAAGSLIRHTGIVTDITGRKQVEAQLFQSQKMETVGKLAGGVAHEFNSILTAIIGQAELMLADLSAASPLAANAQEICHAATRAATLTRELLAYGRKQVLQPEHLDLNRVITGMKSMFPHLMGGMVDTRIILAPDLQAVKADSGQIEQVIMNLAMNARDAMPDGGKLTLETANVSFDEDALDHFSDLKPGKYVMLAITDTGVGMSPEVQARVFEPFFTTKDVGQGTGLGLSTCYGILKQSDGHISVSSEPGRGTTFKVYLPQVERQSNVAMDRPLSLDLPRGTERILLIENEPTLRGMAATLLRRLGYTVWSAADCVEGLSLIQQPGHASIDLLVTDVAMPRLSGKELADRIRESHPDARILFSFVYPEQATTRQNVSDAGVGLIQKPFTPSALAQKIRSVLDQKLMSKR